MSLKGHALNSQGQKSLGPRDCGCMVIYLSMPDLVSFEGLPPPYSSLKQTVFWAGDGGQVV